jgi:hypothetical protein
MKVVVYEEVLVFPVAREEHNVIKSPRKEYTGSGLY